MRSRWPSRLSGPAGETMYQLYSYVVGDRAVYRGQRVIGIFSPSASRRLAIGRIRNYFMDSYTLFLVSTLVVSLRIENTRFGGSEARKLNSDVEFSCACAYFPHLLSEFSSGQPYCHEVYV